MITLLALAMNAHAAPSTAVLYSCEQTNPMQYSDFELRFAANMTQAPGKPVSAQLHDNESGTLRVQSRDLTRRPELDLVGAEAWTISYDANGTGYVLLIPDTGLQGQVDVAVRAIFGGGVAQWDNHFTCRASR